MKVFNHVPPTTPLPDLTAETLPEGRYYTTPENNRYPSVTTILSILSDDAIQAWRDRIGEEEANNISTHAADRGTNLHEILETYIKNQEPVFPEDKKSKVRLMFNRIKRVLNAVDNVIAQEAALY